MVRVNQLFITQGIGAVLTEGDLYDEYAVSVSLFVHAMNGLFA
mgnify:CR=1